VLVPFDDPQAIAPKTIELLDNGTARHAMRKRAYLYTLRHVGTRRPAVHGQFRARFTNERLRNPAPLLPRPEHRKGSRRLPAVKLDHLHCMTDHTGIIEHARLRRSEYPEGYTTDDNARALIVAISLEAICGVTPTVTLDLAPAISHFCGWHSIPQPGGSGIASAMDASARGGRLRDSHGRALWGLGTVLGRTKDAGLRGAAGLCLSWLCPPPSSLRVPGLAPSLCSASWNISNRFHISKRPGSALIAPSGVINLKVSRKVVHSQIYGIQVVSLIDQQHRTMSVTNSRTLSRIL